MSESIYVFTAGDASARSHLSDSIDQPVPLEKIRAHLSEESLSQIEALGISDRLYAWGAVPGKRNIPIWEGMKAGDWLLCVYEARYRYVAKLVLKVHNPGAARAIWGEMPDGSTWEYMYFMSKPDPVNVPLSRLSAYLNAGYMGFTKVGAQRVASIVEQFGSVRSLLDEALSEGYEGSVASHPFDLVSREDVIGAIQKIKQGETAVFEPSTFYDLIFNGERFPPKAAMGMAVLRTHGSYLQPEAFSAGLKSRCFRRLKDLGFEVVEKEEDIQLAYFIIRSNENSDWADKTGTSYHYSNTVPNSRVLSSGGRVIVDRRLSDGSRVIIGHGELQRADESQVDGKVEFVSMFSDWVPIQPHRVITPDDDVLISSQPGFNVQHSIRKISEDAYNKILGNVPMKTQKPLFEPYTEETACSDLFMDAEEFGALLNLFRTKQNLILQGAPGTGKSHIAKRLAFALLGHESDTQVRMIQFHQAYSYEDFMGGYRPAVINGGAGFEYKPGVFARFCESAKLAPNEKFVFIIDEINRGNLSKIFGETMLLIEADKRGPNWGIELTYSSKTDPTFFIPQNVFLLGLMNTADRSLAMVDYALRRRFAFMTLPPAFSAPKFRAHLESRGVSVEVRKKLINGMEALNAEIEKDKDLGKGFLVGHSFFSSPPSPLNDGGEEWLRRVVETELRPLLREYWFDKSEEDIDSKLGTLIG